MNNADHVKRINYLKVPGGLLSVFRHISLNSSATQNDALYGTHNI